MDLLALIRSIAPGYEAKRVTSGQSGGAVYRLTSAAGRPALFLKAAPRKDLLDELIRLEWLHAHRNGPAALSPRVIRFGAEGARSAWMLTTALPGMAAYEFFARPGQSDDRRVAAVGAIAAFLRDRIHQGLAAADCPFRADASVRIALAERHVASGAVDESDFDEARQGWSATQVLAEVKRLAPRALSSTAGLVVTHGDFSLDNIFLNREGTRVTGIIDTGRLGLADPYQDLAILANNLDEFGPSLRRELFRAYGIAKPDTRRVNFHLCLDELF